ncbi:MAG TPA: putative Ig domain-containing protein, partial [Vicinamibacterales bacterium]
IDGADADAVVDGLQFETTIADFVAPNPPIELFSIAVDSATNTIAVSDFAELYENAVPRVVVLQRPRLATFNVQLLDADNQVISNVCAGTTFKVRFSLTVPAGLADVKKVEPTLLIDGVATAVVPEPAAVYPSTTLAAGQVMTFTYSLPGITEDAQLVAGATASNTDDVMFRSLTAFVAHCDDETDPTSIDAVPNVPSQVSGWTPVRENQTYSIDLNAQDDDGIELLEYQLTGATQTPGVISTTFEEVLDQAQVTVPVPDVGRSTLRYRGRDGNGIWSAWQTFEIRTKTVFDRITNENVAVEFRVGDPEGVGFTYSVSGLPDGVTFSPDTGQFAGVVSYDAVLPYSSDPVLSSGVHTVVVTEIAPGGSTSSVSFTWTINHINREPIITTVPGALSIQQGQLFELDIDGYDPDGDPTVFTIVGRSPSGRELPSSITIDRNTGFISGIFPLDSDTSYDIIVGLAECSAITSPPCEQTPPGERLATLLGFTLAVLDANLPADVVNPGAQVSAEGAAVSLQITASDPESDTLTYTAGGLPPGLSIDPNTGLITGIVSYDAAGAHAVTVVVDDHVNTPPRAVTFAWTVTNTNRPPVVSIPDQVGVETQVFTAGTSLAQYVADPDGLPVTFVSVSGLPDGISIAPNGEIAGQFDYDDAGVYTVTVTVSDGALTTTADFTWTVHNVNRAPVLVVANRSSREGDVVSYLLPASDPDGDQLFFTATGLPPGVTLNESSGLISGAFPAGSAGVYQVNIGVKDLIPTGSSPILVSFTWTIRIPNRPPDVVNPGNQLSSEGAIVTLPIAALDPDGDVLSYEVTGLPAGLSMNAAGVITGSPEYNTAGSHTVTVRAIDADGASDAETFTWVINNVNRAPIAIDDAATVVQLAAVAIDVLANDSDPDGTAPTVVSVTAPTSGTAVVNPLTGVVTFTATSAAFTGVSTFSYTVSDGTSTALATVRVTILPNNAPPVCSAATGGEIWPPNHKRFYVAAINGLSDPDGDPIAINVTGIWQDEPIDSTGDGKFAPDGYIADGQAWVRAERNGHGNKAKGNGRVYEIFFTAADNKGGSCSGSVFWTVPHDQGQRSTAIDDGVRYDSTGAIAGARNKSQIHQKSAKP